MDIPLKNWSRTAYPNSREERVFFGGYMHLKPISYDQGARVLLQQNDLIVSRWNDWKWLKATDKKILAIWQAARSRAPDSIEYSLAKRQIQELSTRHSNGLLGWLTRCYHRILNLFGAGITSDEEELLKTEIAKPPNESTPQNLILKSRRESTTRTWNFTQKLADKQDLKEFLRQLLDSFAGAATAYSIRRDPDSLGYNIGFTFREDGLAALKTSIQEKLGVAEDFFTHCHVVKNNCWFSASQTLALIGESRQADLQAYLEERCWAGSQIKQQGGSGLLYDSSYIEEILSTFGQLDKVGDTWSLSMSSPQFNVFQKQIREESNGCIVCPDLTHQVSDKNLLEINKLSNNKIQCIFKGRFKNYLETGEAIKMGQED